jgi:hypothetical protein
MDTFDLFAIRLAQSSNGDNYALALFPATDQPQPEGEPLALNSYATPDIICDHLDRLQFGSEADIMVLRAALGGSLESAGDNMHVARITAEGARLLSFQV